MDKSDARTDTTFYRHTWFFKISRTYVNQDIHLLKIHLLELQDLSVIEHRIASCQLKLHKIYSNSDCIYTNSFRLKLYSDYQHFQPYLKKNTVIRCYGAPLYEAPSVRPSVRLSFRPSVRLSVRPSVHPSVNRSVGRSVGRSVTPSHFWLFRRAPKHRVTSIHSVNTENYTFTVTDVLTNIIKGKFVMFRQ